MALCSNRAHSARRLPHPLAMKFLYCLAALGLSCLCLSVTAAEPVVLGEYECRWAAGPIEIDGKGDEAAWKAAQLIDKFDSPWLGEKAPAGEDRDQGQAALGPRVPVLLRRPGRRRPVRRRHGARRHDLGQRRLRAVLPARPRTSRLLRVPGQRRRARCSTSFLPKRRHGRSRRSSRTATFHWKTAVVRRGTLDNRSDRDEGWSVEGAFPGPTCCAPAAGRQSAKSGGSPSAATTTRSAEGARSCRPAPRSTQAPAFISIEDYAPLKFVRHGSRPAHSRVGIEKRVPLTTSKVVGSPDPPLPYRPVRAFPKLKLTFPIALDRVPGTDQLLVIAQGKSYGATTIFRITGRPGRRPTPSRCSRRPATARPTASAFIPSSPRTAISTSAGTAALNGQGAEEDLSSRGTRWTARSSTIDPTVGAARHRLGIRRPQRRRPGVRHWTACSTSPPATARATPTRTSAART